MSQHLGPRSIQRLRSALGAAEPGTDLLHLLTCAHCRRRTTAQALDDEDWTDGEPGDDPAPLPNPLLERTLSTFHGHLTAACRDRAQAQSLYSELAAHDPERQPARVDGERRFASAALGLHLLSLAEGVVADEPQEAERLARLALRVSAKLEPPWSGFVVAALAGGSWCWIAEARRVRGDLAGADLAYEAARNHLEQLPPLAAERATFCQLSARLRRDQERDDEAFALLSRALEIFEGYPDRERAGDCALDLGWMYLEEMETAEALPLFEQAAVRHAQVEVPGEPERHGSPFGTWLSARHGLAFCYADLRAPEAASQLLAQIRRAALNRPALDPLRALAVEADVAQAMDQLEQAADWLETLWVGFHQEGSLAEAAGAALDLARLYLEQERLDDLDRLNRDVVQTLPLAELQREVVAFSLAFVRRHGLAGVELLESAKRHLRRAVHDPDLPFVLLHRPAPIVLWDEAEPDLRSSVVAAAGLPAEHVRTGSDALRPDERRILVWTAAVVLGVDLRFSPTPPPS